MHQMQTDSVSGEQDSVEMHPKNKGFVKQARDFCVAILYLALETLFLTKPVDITFNDICKNALLICPYREVSIATSIMLSSCKCLIAYTPCSMV